MSTLIRWQLRQLFWINLIALIYLLLMTLYKEAAIFFVRSQWLVLGIFLHCCGIVFIQGRSAPRGSGFLYSQGFTRDQLWWSDFLAGCISGGFCCLLFAITIAAGLRTGMQSLHGNPWAPVMGLTELSAVKWMALEYVVLLSIFHYVWIRARQPHRDASAGWMLALAMTTFCGASYEHLNGASIGWTIILTTFAVSVTLLFLIANWKFHRNVEVQA